MARKAREKSSTGIYAVILRGAGDIFEKESMQNEFEQCAQKYLGSGLMGIRFCSDKVNMLVRESGSGISMDMKPLTTSFARTYNRVLETEGRVFADRFKSVPVETAELTEECMAFLDGGSMAAPYDRAPAGRSIKKAPAEKAGTVQPKQDTPPVKKRDQMPTWLL